MEEKKELRGTTIEITPNSVRFIPEEKTHPWWRDTLDRKKDGLVPVEAAQDLDLIAKNLSKPNETGQLVGKYNLFVTTLQANPKSSQGSDKIAYKNRLINELEKNRNNLVKFKDKEVLLYVLIYLRKERYEKNDVDNFLKGIIDAFKPFIGDDSKITTLIAEKRKLGNYQEADLDFLEQIMIVLTDPQARGDILK